MPLIVWGGGALALISAYIGSQVDEAINPRHEQGFGFNQHTLYLFGTALLVYFMAKKAWKDLA